MRKFNKVVYIGGLNYLPHAPDHLGIRQGFEMLGTDYYILDDIVDYPDHEEVAKKIIEIQPDLVIYGETRPVAGVPPLIKDKIKGLQVFWMLDYRPQTDASNTDYDGGWNHWRQAAPYLDAIIISNKEQIEWWKKDWCLPTFYLPHACWIPPKLEFDEQFKFPTVFIGGRNPFSWYNDRVELIDKINELVGVEWINQGGEGRLQVWKDMPKYYHSSDTVLDISHSWKSRGYCSGRYFYTATLGGCCITKWFEDCEDLFPDGTKHYFNTPEEAAKLIEYYRSHPKEREKNKIKTAQYAWKNHSYKIRFEQLFKLLQSL